MLMLLPIELRCRIYHFAVVEPHPIPLTVCRSKFDPFVRIFVVERDMRLLEVCREFRTEIVKTLYSGNSFSFALKRDELEEGTKLFQVDLGRIQKCYVYVNKIYDPDDSDATDPFDDILELGFDRFVETFIFEGQDMKYLLVECEFQSCDWQVESLKEMAMLRKIDLVHFRSRQQEMRPFFRFLEDLMMSDQPLPFTPTRENFYIMITGDFDGALRPPEFGGDTPPPPTGNAVVKSEEELEATARELYAILGIKGDFIPQSELP